MIVQAELEAGRRAPAIGRIPRLQPQLPRHTDTAEGPDHGVRSFRSGDSVIAIGHQSVTPDAQVRILGGIDKGTPQTCRFKSSK